MGYYLFYITHLVEPYLIYCLTKSYFLGILIPVMYELLEYVVYSTLGNYSIVYLEDGEGTIESVDNIILYDIGGAILATYIAFTLYHIYDIDNIVIKGLKEWKMILLYVVKAVISGPISAIGWECDETASSIISSLCPENGDYQLFPWGLLGLILINVIYIFYIFQGTQRYVTLSFPVVVFLTGMQRVVYNVVLAMWISVGISVIFTVYWVYILCKKNDYGALPTGA